MHTIHTYMSCNTNVHDGSIKSRGRTGNGLVLAYRCAWSSRLPNLSRCPLTRCRQKQRHRQRQRQCIHCTIPCCKYSIHGTDTTAHWFSLISRAAGSTHSTVLSLKLKGVRGTLHSVYSHHSTHHLHTYVRTYIFSACTGHHYIMDFVCM